MGVMGLKNVPSSLNLGKFNTLNSFLVFISSDGTMIDCSLESSAG